MGRPRKVGEPLPLMRTLAWLSKCRGMLIHWEKKVENCLGLLKLACAPVCLRHYHQLSRS